MRRFLLDILPNGFHRIRNNGLLAKGHRADKLPSCRSLFVMPTGGRLAPALTAERSFSSLKSLAVLTCYTACRKGLTSTSQLTS